MTLKDRPMTEKVALVTDSICCLPGEILERYKITVVPVNILVGEKIYRDVGPETGTGFVEDAKSALVNGKYPEGWHEMPAHELLYGRGWHCIGRMGFVEGDENRPGIEFEVDPGTVGSKAQVYLREVLH